MDYIPPFETALTEVANSHSGDKLDVSSKIYHVGFRGSFGDHHVNPRTLRAHHLSRMISVEGIVTRCK